MSRTRLGWAISLIGGFMLFLTFAPLMAGAPIGVFLVWFAVVGAIDVAMAWRFYWLSSLAYFVSEDGLTINDYRGVRHLKWDEIAGVRLVPFNKIADYNLELKNGKTQKIVSNIEEGFIDAIKLYVPQTKYWYSPE